MKVHVILERCADPFYEPHPLGIFSTASKAGKELEGYENKEYCKIVEVAVDKPLKEQAGKLSEVKL